MIKNIAFLILFVIPLLRLPGLEEQFLIDWHNSKEYKKLYQEEYKTFWHSKLYIDTTYPENYTIYDYFLYRPLKENYDPETKQHLSPLKEFEHGYTFNFVHYENGIKESQTELYFTPIKDGYYLYKVRFFYFNDDSKTFTIKSAIEIRQIFTALVFNFQH